MSRSRIYLVVAGTLLAWAAMAAPVHALERISREHRWGLDYEELLEVGQAQVSASAIFSSGVRLSAHDADPFVEPSIASAVYFFEIPIEAEYIRIRLSYRDHGWQGAPYSGFLWVRDREEEEVFRDVCPDAEEEGFIGQAFPLDRDREEEIFWLAAGPVRMDGLLEAHIVAASGNVLDVDWIEVCTYLQPPPIFYCSSILWYRTWRPPCSFGYFYVGPWCIRTGGTRYRRWTPIFRSAWTGWGDHRKRFLLRYDPALQHEGFMPPGGRPGRDLEVSPLLKRLVSRPGGFPRLRAIHRLKRSIASARVPAGDAGVDPGERVERLALDMEGFVPERTAEVPMRRRADAGRDLPLASARGAVAPSTARRWANAGPTRSAAVARPAPGAPVPVGVARPAVPSPRAVTRPPARAHARPSKSTSSLSPRARPASRRSGRRSAAGKSARPSGHRPSRGSGDSSGGRGKRSRH